MSATVEAQRRLDVEDALAAWSDAEERLRCVMLRISSRMRTLAEAADLAEIGQARAALRKVQAHLVAQHARL